MISTQNLSHFETDEKRSSFMKSVGYLDFNEFFVEVGVIQIGSFSKQMDVTWFITYLWQDRSFQQIFIRTSTLFRRFLYTYICLYKYPGTVGIAAIEM